MHFQSARLKEQPLAENGHGITNLQGQHSERCALDQLDIILKLGDTESFKPSRRNVVAALSRRTRKLPSITRQMLRDGESEWTKLSWHSRLSYTQSHAKSHTDPAYELTRGPYFLLFLILLLRIKPPLDVNADSMFLSTLAPNPHACSHLFCFGPSAACCCFQWPAFSLSIPTPFILLWSLVPTSASTGTSPCWACLTSAVGGNLAFNYACFILNNMLTTCFSATKTKDVWHDTLENHTLES